VPIVNRCTPFGTEGGHNVICTSSKLKTIRMLIALATKYHWKGFVKSGQEHLVCKLKKELYVLK
jgi:hypothetical protein